MPMSPIEIMPMCGFEAAAEEDAMVVIGSVSVKDLQEFVGRWLRCTVCWLLKCRKLGGLGLGTVHGTV